MLFKLDKHGAAMELNVADVLRVPRGARGSRTTRGAICGKRPRRETATRAVRRTRAPAATADGRPAGSTEDDDAPAALGVRTRVARKRQAAAKKKRPAKGTPLDFSGWCLTRFLELCVLSGCDFLPRRRRRRHQARVPAGCAHDKAKIARGAPRDGRVPVPEAYDAGFRARSGRFGTRACTPRARSGFARLTPLRGGAGRARRCARAFLRASSSASSKTTASA